MLNEEFATAVPLPLTSSWSDCLYLYCRALIGWVLSMYNIYEVKRIIREKRNVLELETELLYRIKPINCKDETIKGLMDCLSGEYDSDAEDDLESMLSQIKTYDSFVAETEATRRIKPNRENADHRELLGRLFESVTNRTVTVGVTKEADQDEETRPDWTAIGFQGLDPITDFRGGGLLSLRQLVYFADENKEIIDKINERANHVKTGYGLAITGINITVMLMDALKSGHLKQYFYHRQINDNQLNQLYAQCFLLFDRLWAREQPEDIMRFSAIFTQFKKLLADGLKSGHVNELL